MAPVLLDPVLFIAHLGSLYSLLTAPLPSLAVCVPVTTGWRTINLLIEFSKVCRSIKSMEENVSTRNKQEHVDVIEKKSLSLDFIGLISFCPGKYSEP